MITFIFQLMLSQLLFVLLYEIFLRKETFFVANRSFLLFSLGSSFVLPFLQIKISDSVVQIPVSFWLNEVVLSANASNVSNQIGIATPINTSYHSSFSILEIIWLVGSCVFFGLFLRKIGQLFRLYKQSIQTQFKNQIVYMIPESNLAFSFFNKIFIGNQIPKENFPILLKHEKIHVNQKHSLDLLILEILKILFWWNPFIFWYQNRLHEIHEFLADEPCKYKKSYYMKLLQTVFEVPHISFTNSFFTNSLIKSRIMMLQKKSNPRKTWRYALALPVIALMLFLNCTQEIQTKVEPEANLTENELIDLYVKNAKQKMEQGESYEAQLNLLKQEYDLKPDKNLKLNMVTLYTLVTNDKKSPYRKIDDYTNEGLNYKENPDAIPFSLVNTVPVYENADPTDKDFFQNYIQKHIRKNFVYPNEALDAGIQGRVYLSFVIDEKGKVHVENVRGPDTTLENACIEIFEKMPNASTPATLNGESVAMKMSVPITFKIQ